MAHSTLSKLSDKDKQKCDEVAKLLASRHGNYWLPDVPMDKEKLKQIKAESDAGNMLIANLDTFETLDWLQPYLQGKISPEQRKFIDEHKTAFVKQIIFREQMDYHKYKHKMEYAQSQIDFWQGKTMENRVKDVIFGIPLAFWQTTHYDYRPYLNDVATTHLQPTPEKGRESEKFTRIFGFFDDFCRR